MFWSKKVYSFLLFDAVHAHQCASDAHRCTSAKLGAWPSLQWTLSCVHCVQFEDSFENAHWRKVKQVQPVRLCMLWSKFFWKRGLLCGRFKRDRRQIKQKFPGTCIIDHRYKWNQWFTRQHHHDPLEGCGCSGEPHFPASETGTAAGKVAGLWCSPHHQSGGPAHSPLSQFQPLHSCARLKWFERTHEKTQRN